MNQKKDQCNRDQDLDYNWKSQEDSIRAIELNALKSIEKKKKKKWERDLNTITCYNYDKKEYYANKYLDPPKN